MPASIPPLVHSEPLAGDPVISPGKLGLPESQHDVVPTLLSTVGEDEDRPLGVLDHHNSPMDRVYPPSESARIDFQDTSHVDPVQSTTLDPSSGCIVDPSRATLIAKEQEHGNARGDSENRVGSGEELRHTQVQSDNKHYLSSTGNSLWIAIAERDEAWRNQLADLSNMTQQVLFLCEEKKVLMERQWTERLRWQGECDLQTRELTRMASWLIEVQVAASQSQAHQRQANDDDPSTLAPRNNDSITVLSTVDRGREISGRNSEMGSGAQ